MVSSLRLHKPMFVCKFMLFLQYFYSTTSSSAAAPMSTVSTTSVGAGSVTGSEAVGSAG